MSQLSPHFLVSRESLPDGDGDLKRWRTLEGSAFALAAHETALQSDGPVLIISNSSQDAQWLAQELAFFANQKYSIDIFPDYETLIYDGFSPHQDIVSDRLRLLSRDFSERSIIIVPASTLLMKLPPKAFLIGHNLKLTVGDRLNIAHLRRQLEAAAYRAVDTVVERG